MPAMIIIGADLVPTESNYDLFKAGNSEALIGSDLREKLRECEFSIFNLEVPLTDEQHPIKKCGPNLIAPTTTISGLKAINPYFFTLANNHIMDQGVKGLESTIKTLKYAGIEWSGIGRNLGEACKPFVKKIGGKKIGIYCCAEHEFSIATESTPGANPFDPLESLEHVENLKRDTDYVIVLYHGGKEHYRYPSPHLQQVCRKLVKKGADLVVCQHSHCIGCEEKYAGGTIVYGQGNFLFDSSNSEYWQTSLLIEIDNSFNISYAPIAKKNNGVRLADEVLKREILDDFHIRSENIKDQKFVLDEYLKFSKSVQKYYLSVFLGRRSFLFRIIDKLVNHKLLDLFTMLAIRTASM